MWIHIDTYLNKETITCPACNENITVTKESDNELVEIECLCGQALRLHRSTAVLTELFAKEEDDVQNRTEEGSKEIQEQR